MSQNFNINHINYLMNNTDDSICVVSASGKLLYTNPSAEKLFGISADGEKKIWNAIPYVQNNEGLMQLFIDAVTQKKDSHEAIVNYTNNEGKVKQLHVKMTWYKTDMAVFLVVISDLSQLFKLHSAFIRYTSPDIAEYVLSSPEGEKSGGKLKTVSILMSDLRGFTAMSTSMPSNDLIVMLNHYFEKMSSIIEAHHGTIIEFLGDGIFVVFGAPKYYSDHASLAVKCAVEMENAMDEVNKWNKEMKFPELEMGIAINSGLVVVGNIGSENKMKYGCMGETVNIAGRVESLTVGGQVYITENTKALIPEELTISAEDSFLPKGKNEELKIYEITSIGDLKYANAANYEIKWKDHPDNTEYSFYMIERKVVGETEHKCRFTKISTDSKYAIMVTEMELKSKQNIMLIIDGEQESAKVIEQEEEGYKICFTSPRKILS